MSQSIESRLDRLEKLVKKMFDYSVKTGDHVFSHFHNELKYEIEDLLEEIDRIKND